MCNSTCDGYLEPTVSAAPLTLTASPEPFVGLFLSDSFLSALCIEVVSPGYDIRDDFFSQFDTFYSRIVVTNVEMVIENPIVIADDGLSPYDGRAISIDGKDMLTVLPGSYLVPAGSTVAIQFQGSSTLPCGGCGSAGTVRDRFCAAPPGPGPCRSGDCPSWDVPPDGTLVTFPTVDPAFSSQPVGPMDVECFDTCRSFGAPQSCPDEPGGVFLPPEAPFVCAVSDLTVNKTCAQMGAHIQACACAANPTGDCAALNPNAGFQVFDECMFAIGNDASQSCLDRWQNDPNDALGDVVSLAYLNQLCHANPSNPRCLGYAAPSSERGMNIAACNQLGGFGSGRCTVCSPFTGHGCLPTIDVPAWLDHRLVGTVVFGEHSERGSTEAAGGGGNSGPYYSQTSAQGLGGTKLRLTNPKLRQQLDGDPVSLLTGELVHDTVDVSFPSRGVPFEFRRHYRSGGLRSGSLGPAFSHSYEERIVPVGDLHNRQGMPDFCTADLPFTTCLLRTDEEGGTELWVLDPTTYTFQPPPGVQGGIHVRFAGREHHVANDNVNLNATTDYVYEHLSPGGVLRTYDLTGVLLSVTDEKGFGVVLRYREKTQAEVMAEGAWTNVEQTVLGPLYSSLEAAQAQAERFNSLNAMELVKAIDSYGREFTFKYGTYFDHYGTTTSGTRPKRRRLEGIYFRGDRLVEYRYSTLELDTTSDAYLSEVVRRGFLADGAVGDTSVTTYAYDHWLFDPGQPLHRLQDGVVGWGSDWANAIDATLEELETDRMDCGNVNIRINPQLDDPCSVRVTPDAVGSPPPGQNDMWDIVRRAIADNIVRIEVDGEIQLESRYDINIFRPTFDHVIEQRYGQIPLLLDPPEPVEEDELLVHVWYTDMPQASIEYVDTEPLLLEVITHGPLEEEPPDDLDLPPGCGFEVLAQLPLFDHIAPVGPRTDFNVATAIENIPLKQTAAGCQALAGRWSGAHNPTGLDQSPDAERLAKRTWDLNTVCRWAISVDRQGVDHIYGLNLDGTALFERHPSPTGAGFVQTERRVNVDGNLVYERAPDGQVTKLSYDSPHVRRLTRHLVTKIEEVPGTLAFAEPARAYSLTSQIAGASTASRTTLVEYEPFFQQPTKIVLPDNSERRFVYDYQQDTFYSLTAEYLARQHLFRRAGAELPSLGDYFFGADYDGDGIYRGESSAQVVVAYTAGVRLSPTETADVGERFLRDSMGRVEETWRIQAADDPDEDFDRTVFQYYQDLPKAEAGDLSIGNCRKPCGPLGKTTRYRTPTSTAANDLDISFIAYDRHGGVRLERCCVPRSSRVFGARKSA
jgi:hypothetical protein